LVFRKSHILKQYVVIFSSVKFLEVITYAN